MARQLWSTAACTSRGSSLAKRNTAQEPPAQPWRMQVPAQHLCASGGKASG